MKKVYLLLVLFLFTTCNTTTKPPQKLSNIPDEAVWYGGTDGGYWYIVKDGKNKNSFFISIYYDSTGEIAKRTLFSLSKSCSHLGFNKDSIYKYINGYDGNIVYLTIINKEGKYCYLKPKK